MYISQSALDWIELQQKAQRGGQCQNSAFEQWEMAALGIIQANKKDFHAVIGTIKKYMGINKTCPC